MLPFSPSPQPSPIEGEGFFHFFVIPANLGSGSGQASESSKFNRFWMPPAYYMPGQAYQVRHDNWRAFYPPTQKATGLPVDEC